MYKSAPENEADVAALVACLRMVSIGDTVTKRQLSDVIGRTIESRRYLVYRAFGILEKEQGIVFANVHRVGYRRLPIDAVPSVGRRTRRSIRRKAGQKMKTMSNAAKHANDLPNDTSIALGREISVLGYLRATARDFIVSKATDGIAAGTSEPTARMAERFLAAFRA